MYISLKLELCSTDNGTAKIQFYNTFLYNLTQYTFFVVKIKQNKSPCKQIHYLLDECTTYLFTMRALRALFSGKPMSISCLTLPSSTFLSVATLSFNISGIKIIQYHSISMEICHLKSPEYCN